MDWMESIRSTINYLEDNIYNVDEDIKVAEQVGVSSFYLQKGFSIITGYSMAEYLRNRRLYMAALDVIKDDEKVIDIAFRYGYDTPESFTKAFTRFHGVSPIQLKKNPSKMQIFLPLTIRIDVQGGNHMDYVIEKVTGFKVVGFEREFSMDTSYAEIPKFWQEFSEKYMDRLCSGVKPENDVEETICNCMVGMYGICIDDIGGNGRFRYLIAGEYTDGEVPEGMVSYEFPELTWAKFKCVGPLPGSLQSVNTKLFSEWLPGNPDYEVSFGANIEWYGDGNPQSVDYESGIWVPVKHK